MKLNLKLVVRRRSLHHTDNIYTMMIKLKCYDSWFMGRSQDEHRDLFSTSLSDETHSYIVAQLVPGV